MSNTIPIPQPDAYEYLIADVWRTQTHWNGVKASAYRCLYATEKVHAHAAAVSAADNAALRAELAKHQESEFHPDWSMLSATRDCLAEYQEIAGELQERVKQLEALIKTQQDLRTAFNTELLSCFHYTQQPDNPAVEVLRLVSNLCSIATLKQLETARNSRLL